MSLITSGSASDFLAFKPGPTSADTSTAATGPYHSVVGARQICGVISLATVLQGSTVTVRLMQATSAGGADSKLLKEVEVVIPADDPAVSIPYTLSVNASASDLDQNGFNFVAVQIETSVEDLAGSGLLVLGGLRFNPAV